jgi:pimeloyl-ACP methyl ester carboxylesterase
MQFDVDGRSAYAYTGGRPFDAARPVVALVHGAQHDHSVWILQSRFLAHHGFSVLAVDLPGHGRSAGPALPDVGSMAAWLLRALAAVGAARAAIVGHSMGSLIALEAAGRSPAAVRGVALIGIAIPMKVSDQLLEAARDDEPAAFDMINKWSHARLVHRPGSPGPGFSLFVQNLRLMQRQPPGVLLNDFTACNVYTQGLDRAQALACPALIVHGARDAMAPPRAARELVRAMPGASVVEIPGCGHNAMGEAPDEVRDALYGWLRSPALAAAAAAAAPA